jgi:hypothetical protein
LLGRIFVSKRGETRGGWRKLHNLHSSPNIIIVIKSWGLRWSWLAASMGEMRNVYKIFVGKPEVKRPHLEDGIILK